MLRSRLLSLFLLTAPLLLRSQVPVSIHQQQHEHFREITTAVPDTSVPLPASLQRRVPEPLLEVLGYHPYWMGTAWENYRFDLLTTIAYFGVELNKDGSIGEKRGWPASSLINTAHQNGVRVVLVAILFNTSDLETLLRDSTNRKRAVDNLLKEVTEAGADGVNIDFEGVPGSQRKNLVSFMKELTQTFRGEDSQFQVTIAMPAVDWRDAFDYKALAEACDGLMIMGYDYHYSGSSVAGPVAPLKGWGTFNVTWTVNDYINETGQPEKLILGCPYYGYQWPTVSGEKGAPTTSTATAKIYSSAKTLASTHGRRWDEESLTPWYRFENNGWTQGWYEDSLSLSHKYALVQAENLKGVGIWALGYDGSEPELWGALSENFDDTLPPPTPRVISVTNTGDGNLLIDFDGSHKATHFNVYRWTDETGDQILGSFATVPIQLTDLSLGEVHYLRLSAANVFGESRPTELLGAVPSTSGAHILVVNGFDRTDGTDNTRDFVRQHGSSISAVGYPFDAASNESVESGSIDLIDYWAVDWLLGEEGTATNSFTAAEQSMVKSFLENGGNLFVSGSEIGYDLVAKGSASDSIFYADYLKSHYISDAAGGRQGVYEATGTDGGIFSGLTEVMFDDGSQGTYDVDWPDGIKPADGAVVNLKYRNVDFDSRGGAGIQFRGTFGSGRTKGAVIHLAIPLETIYPNDVRDEAMKRVFNFFGSPLSVTDLAPLPEDPSIQTIYPNPSNSQITILLDLPVNSSGSSFRLQIVDLLGRTVWERRISTNRGGGPATIVRNGLTSTDRAASSGIYTAVLSWSGGVSSHRFVLLK